MDILIKSFNRPYYLDRCIQSIYRNVQDKNLHIVILDDGTPAKYLEKIKKKFHEIEIIKSKFHEMKTNSLAQNKAIETTNVPIELWLQSAQNASDYFLLLEDDIWFTKKIDLEETQNTLKENTIYMLKLFWLNNPQLVYGTTKKINNFISIYTPRVFTKLPFLHRLIFGTTRFGIRKCMAFLGLFSKEKALHYYSIYGVAGAIFQKKYFLSLWKGHNNEVDENLQLKNAVQFWYKNPLIQFARTEEEIVATGFSSSATNKNYDTGQFDIFTFNKILNEAWFEDRLLSVTDFNNDLSKREIETILLQNNNPKADVSDWHKWTTSFKKQFQDIGCTI
jgi:glycosyltransferase involved in cell wall biosynthesis